MAVLLAIAALITLLVGVVSLIFISGKLEDSVTEEVGGEAPRPLSRKQERELAYQAKLAAREAARLAEEKARRVNEPVVDPQPTADPQVLSAEEEEALFSNISSRINGTKTIPITFETIAAEFELRGTEEAVERVRRLAAEGIITGVIDDDRGCFTGISEETMNRVALLIRKLGRVTAADIQRALCVGEEEVACVAT